MTEEILQKVRRTDTVWGESGDVMMMSFSTAHGDSYSTDVREKEGIMCTRRWSLWKRLS